MASSFLYILLLSDQYDFPVERLLLEMDGEKEKLKAILNRSDELIFTVYFGDHKLKDF